MHDIVFRGASIVDGTGRPPFTGDVAIDGERIAAVGGKAGPGRREVAAEGLLLTPGWVDVHTHYDGQATWDSMLAPSSWHGTTTILMGNCGVGFAPCRPRDHAALIDLMEGVEDIPGIALAEGLEWDWETFPEFLSALERRKRTIDIGTQMPHHPLRVYVMGERALRHEAATPEDIAVMRKLTEEGLRAGAFGFTTSRTELHKTMTGAHVPGYFAKTEELLGIAEAIKTTGIGAFGMLSDFADEAEEFSWLRDLARETQRPVWFLLTDRLNDPQRWRRLLNGVRAAKADGLPVSAQIAGRPVGLILGLQTSLTPFTAKATFASLAKLDPKERLAKLRDPAIRRAILAEGLSDTLLDIMQPQHRHTATRWDRLYVLGDPPDYEPGAESSIMALAAKAGQSPAEFAYDYLTGANGERLLYFPVTNYVTGDHEPLRAMLTEPGTVVGLGDGGAHCGVICDASVPTFMLTHWARDRHRGERLPLEWVIKRQTQDTAAFFGFTDRGTIAPGLRADLNLIDYAGLRLHAPELAYDLPAGGRRLIQYVDGYRMTTVAGTPVFENGEHTGALPGRLVRSGTAGPR
ncbi:MAG: amidohydrolase family protein [Alphaproteobacteria bacterium]|nr:amidohydrolase family protein [Alphaproteobacteria bacterium]